MVKGLPYYTIWEIFCTIIPNIYVDRAIFLPFCDHQENESE